MTNDLRIREIQAELTYLEERLNELTLPHSDQQLLTEAWHTLQDELDDLEDILPWRVIGDLESPPGGSPPPRPPTPIPDEPLRLFIDYSNVSAITITEEEQNRMNSMVDDRCEGCAGCVYCVDYGGTYDQSDEV